MNKVRRKALERYISQLEEIKEAIECEMEDEDEKHEGMISEEMKEISEEASDNMQSAIDSIEEALDYLSTAAE